MAILESVTPLVEQLSIDEAFLDVEGVRRQHGAGEDVAGMLRGRVRTETGLTLSVGVATTKFLAKLASDLAKPDGLLVIAPGTELAFLDPLPVTRLWGVGPATFRTLDRMAVRTIGDVARLAEASLVGGARARRSARTCHALVSQRRPARRRARPGHEVDRRGGDLRYRPALRSRVSSASSCGSSDRVAARLRAAGYVARTVTLKIRFADFETRTRARTLPIATDLTATIAETARALLEHFDVGSGVRLLGVSASNLEHAAEAQQVLLLDDEAAEAHAPTRAARRDRSGHRRSARPLRRRRGATRDVARRGARSMIKVGLVGCGHIGTVHGYAIHQLTKAGLVDAALTATYDTDGERAARVGRALPRRRAAPTLEELVASVDVVWVCTWTAAHLEAVDRSRSRPGAPCSARSRSPRPTPTASASRRRSSRCPHQVGLVLRYAPVFAHAAEIVASGKYGRPLATTLRDDQYFPIQGLYGSTWRKDVASAGGGTLIEHSIHDVDVLRWMLGDPETVAARVSTRFGHAGIDDIVAVTLAYADGSVAQLTSVWHQVLSRESSRRLEVVLRGRPRCGPTTTTSAPSTCRPAPGTEVLEFPLPEWASRLRSPRSTPRRLAAYATPTKAFLDALAPSRAPTRSGTRTRPTALAAHRLVDRAYASAAAGGAPESVGARR